MSDILSLRSWVDVPPGSDFPIQNLPFGIFKPSHLRPRVGMAIGNQVIDLAALSALGFLDGLALPFECLENDYLNDLIALGKEVTQALRLRVMDLLRHDNNELQSQSHIVNKCFYAQSDVGLRMPVRCGDYTDFYSSIEHATNVGIMFRGKDNALMPNWKHLPVGYHGRASSIVVSGTDIRRPWGQVNTNQGPQPEFCASRQLDFELEVAFVVGKSNPLGQPVHAAEAESHIFGLMLFNDWSARDIQSWEYVPLGPFLGKNFGSSVSPWIVTLEALAPFRVESPVQDPPVLPYLQTQGARNIDIALDVIIQPENGEETCVSHSNFKYMYWNMAQQLAHHTVNGCNLQVGDICASGTISGPEPGSYGSMLELTWRGTKPITLHDGSERKFLLDGDTVIMRGHCVRDGLRIGFGEVKGKVLPAR